MSKASSTSNRVNRSRRALLKGRVKEPAPVVRPPWALGENTFLDGCSRCEACISACPEGIIVSGEGGFPEIDFSHGGCTFCRECVNACPEPLFSDPERSVPWSHRVDVQQSCLAHQSVFCQSCGDACEAGAIRFDLRTSRVPAPEVDAGQCTGCGFCAAVCPVDAISIAPRGGAGPAR